MAIDETNCQREGPEVLPINAQAWDTFRIMLSQFEREAMSGMRVRLNYQPIMTLAIHGLRLRGGELIDFMERVSILESEMLTIEVENRKADEKRKEKAKQARDFFDEAVH